MPNTRTATVGKIKRMRGKQKADQQGKIREESAQDKDKKTQK